MFEIKVILFIDEIKKIRKNVLNDFFLINMFF